MLIFLGCMNMISLLIMRVLIAVLDLSSCLNIVLFYEPQVIDRYFSLDYGGRNDRDGSLLQGIFPVIYIVT